MRPLQGCRSRGVVVGTVTLCLAAGWALQSKCPTPSLPPLLPPPAPSSCSRPRCPAQPQRLPTPARGQRNRERLGRGWGRDIPRLRQASLLCEGCAWSGKARPRCCCSEGTGEPSGTSSAAGGAPHAPASRPLPGGPSIRRPPAAFPATEGTRSGGGNKPG